MTKIDIIIEFLKARFEADIEVRESSYLTEHSNHDFVFGGARIFDIEGEEYVVSVNQIRGTGITLLDFDVEGVRYGGKIVKETEAEKIERETASLKAELEASSSSFELDYRNHQFAFGQQILYPVQFQCQLASVTTSLSWLPTVSASKARCSATSSTAITISLS
ncbi:hypothetical protein HGG76_27460 [Ochrobactrum tritici]|uniref:Uncharacterized protein n=1 Tax=Brucella tritici TaxID=94626 RepID=A0A7X6JBS0_9HYPH|nr:hypothetical protein [Brucella tritici]